jgi:hypothetical protein
MQARRDPHHINVRAFLKTAFITFFSVLPLSVATAQHNFQRGLTWEDNRYNALPVLYGSNNLPPAKSLKSYYPKVVIQPQTDLTGVAWAAIWNARTAAEAIACNQSDPQKVLQLAFSPAYNYGLIRKNPDCKEAISMIDLLESMTTNGTPFFSEFREFCPSEVPADLYPVARNKRLSGYIKLFNTRDAQNIKVQSVKNALVSNRAVLAGLICPPSFHLAQEFWQPREPTPDPSHGGHAVCIVGYDDTRFGGAFEVLNTWGKDWGMQGYTWIRYKDFADYTQYAFGLFQSGGASCHVYFDGNVVFKLLSGEEMKVNVDGSEGKYKFGKSYPTGTTFTVQASTNLPVYLYSLGFDPGGTAFPLFPRKPETMPITFSALTIPDDMPAITLTDPPGKNEVYFIFSPFKLEQKDVTKIVKENSPAAGGKWNERGLGFSGNLKGPVIMKVVLDQTRK